ncbi:MAG: YhjD/YihY/BrkB family envelope integrity protein [Frankiaceae bacterium]
MTRDVRAEISHHDLTLMAAGTTFYLAVAGIPMVLIAIRLATLLTSPERVLKLGLRVATGLPSTLHTDQVARNMITAGSRLTLTQGLLSLVPASLYGEGLRRAFQRLSPRRASGMRTAWQGRAIAVALLTFSPLLTLAALFAAVHIPDAVGSGVGGTLLGGYLAFLTGWLLISATLVLLYRALAPGRPGIRALLLGAFGTGSFVAGFLIGFAIFLAIPLRIGEAYGGFEAVAAAAVAGGWLMLLHALVLIGYSVTLCLDARRAPAARHPAAPISWQPSQPPTEAPAR